MEKLKGKTYEKTLFDGLHVVWRGCRKLQC